MRSDVTVSYQKQCHPSCLLIPRVQTDPIPASGPSDTPLCESKTLSPLTRLLLGSIAPVPSYPPTSPHRKDVLLYLPLLRDPHGPFHTWYPTTRRRPTSCAIPHCPLYHIRPTYVYHVDRLRLSAFWCIISLAVMKNDSQNRRVLTSAESGSVDTSTLKRTFTQYVTGSIQPV
jgi:hypothetical protein